jgi:hypothetical protein
VFRLDVARASGQALARSVGAINSTIVCKLCYNAPVLI